MNFQSLTECNSKVHLLCGYEESTPPKEILISDYLQISAGKTEDLTATVYRPFLVAAIMLSQDLDYQTLSEAKGVKFTLMQNPILSLSQMQKSYDISQKLVLPSGFSVQEFLDTLNKESSEIMSMMTV